LVLPYINMNLPQVYTCFPSWIPPPSIQYHASNLNWRSISHMISYMFQRHSPKSSHPRPLPQSPKDCSVHQCLFCCLIYREGDGTLRPPMDRGTWWAAVHGVARSQTRLSDFTLFFHFHALEKEMATHSIVLAWRIPGTGEGGFRKGNTCIPVADSCWCMAKPIQYCKVINLQLK